MSGTLFEDVAVTKVPVVVSILGGHLEGMCNECCVLITLRYWLA